LELLAAAAAPRAPNARWPAICFAPMRSRNTTAFSKIRSTALSKWHEEVEIA